MSPNFHGAAALLGDGYRDAGEHRNSSHGSQAEADPRQRQQVARNHGHRQNAPANAE
jgi:hypothetical protein